MNSTSRPVVLLKYLPAENWIIKQKLLSIRQSSRKGLQSYHSHYCHLPPPTGNVWSQHETICIVTPIAISLSGVEFGGMFETNCPRDIYTILEILPLLCLIYTLIMMSITHHIPASDSVCLTSRWSAGYIQMFVVTGPDLNSATSNLSKVKCFCRTRNSKIYETIS